MTFRTIRSRIVAGFAAVALALGVSAATAALGLLGVSRDIQSLQVKSRETVALAEVKGDMAAAALAMREYLMHRRPASLEEARRAAAETLTGITALEATASPDSRPALSGLAGLARDFEQGLGRLAALATERRSLADGVLSEAGRAMRVSVTAWMDAAAAAGDPASTAAAGRLQQHVLLARSYLQAYLAEGDAGAIERSLGEIERAGALFGELKPGLARLGRGGEIAAFESARAAYLAGAQRVRDVVRGEGEVRAEVLDVWAETSRRGAVPSRPSPRRLSMPSPRPASRGPRPASSLRGLRSAAA